MTTKDVELNIIVEFLAYTLVVEVGVCDYIQRINKHFGW